MLNNHEIRSRVHRYYWEENINCAMATLKNLAESFGVSLHPQLIDAALGMHGAGKYRAQCGLVEGTLLFIGIFGRLNQLPDEEIVTLCRSFAEAFENHFSSLQCRILRPQGFAPDNSHHICEGLTCRANDFSIQFIAQKIPLK